MDTQAAAGALTDLPRIEGLSVMRHGPQPAGQFVGQGTIGFVMALPLLHRQGPGLHRIQRLAASLFHARGLQHGSGAVDEQRPQVGIPAFSQPT